MRYVIAIVMNGNELWKYRILDTDSYSINDLYIDEVKVLIKENKLFYNIKLDAYGKIKFTDGNENDYTKINDADFVLNKKTFTILGIEKISTLETRYYVCDHVGNVSNITRTEVIDLVNKKGYSATNASIKGFLIKPYRGNFIKIKALNKTKFI